MRRAVTVLALAVLAAAAGCGLPAGPPAGSSGGTASVTPAGVPGADPSGVAYPDGLWPGAVDPELAPQRHREAVANGSYVLTYERRTVEKTANDSRTVRSLTREFRVAGPRRYLERIRSGPTGDGGDRRGRLRSTVFADGTDRYERVGTGPGAVFVRRPASARDPTARLTGSLLRRFLAAGNATVERRAVDGRPAAVVRLRNVSGGAGSRLTGTVTAVVRTSGLVERLTAELRRQADGGGLVRTVAFEYRRVPALSVEPPPWYGLARAETGGGVPGGTDRFAGGVGFERRS
jgi:hypothetical protein